MTYSLESPSAVSCRYFFSSGCNYVFRTGACQCEHNTQGVDCQECKPLYNNKPWSFATTQDAHECEKCECNGKADACVYDEELGHGRCVDCRDNTSGAMCEQCAPNHYRDESTGECVSCACHSEGSTTAQCRVKYFVIYEKSRFCNNFENLLVMKVLMKHV